MKKIPFGAIVAWFKGKKTYFVAAAAAIVLFCWKVGWVDDTLAQQLLLWLGVGGMVTLRAALAKK